jgi:hypothetical protein
VDCEGDRVMFDPVGAAFRQAAGRGEAVGPEHLLLAALWDPHLVSPDLPRGAVFERLAALGGPEFHVPAESR